MAVVETHPGTTISVPHRAPVVWLDDADAADPTVVGAKAANLAVARQAGLPTIDGFVVTVAEAGSRRTEPSSQVADAWRALSGDGALPLVVRSSSPIEDLAGGSMAGMFDSVVDVRGWEAFAAAYRRVIASSRGGDMAVLVQHLVNADLGGVLFGVDPVSGRDDRVVVAAVHGAPHRLVAGEVEGRRLVLRRTGRVVAVDGDPAPVLSRALRRRLLALAGRAGALFGGPQDIEWAVAGHRLVLLQSRPVTAVSEPGTGPVLGPGPVAETFPAPLSPLEVDLWVPPLRDATVEALRITGAAGRRRLARSPVVAVVDGQVAADLELIGVVRTGNRVLRAIDPRAPLRRLGASWRVGRLRGAFPQLASHVIERVDHDLTALPDPATLADDDLLLLLDNVSVHLRVVHTHEMLAGALLGEDGGTAAGVALRELARGRAHGWSDADVVARTPVVLALLPPTTGARPPLPAVLEVPASEGDGTIGTRERLRLRIRWLHELSAAVVRELGARLRERGLIADADGIRQLSRADLPGALRGPPVVAAVVAPVEAQDVAPLPAWFRLSASGAVVTEPLGPSGQHGIGAGGGRGVGTVSAGEPAAGEVLVVRTLDPALAAVLPRIGGLVAETGSPLSHLAILAREHGIPVVVGAAGAIDRFPPGSRVVVDGGSGVVELVDGASSGR